MSTFKLVKVNCGRQGDDDYKLEDRSSSPSGVWVVVSQDATIVDMAVKMRQHNLVVSSTGPFSGERAYLTRMEKGNMEQWFLAESLDQIGRLDYFLLDEAIELATRS